MKQGRWVTYIFRYRNGARCENAGFIKIQRLTCKSGDEARIQIGLKLLKDIPCKCKVYMLLKDSRARYLTDMAFKAKERDTIMKRVEISWEHPFDELVPFDDYDGLFFECDDGELLAGLWHEHAVDIGNIIVDSMEKEGKLPEDINNSMSDISGEIQREGLIEESREISEDISDSEVSLTDMAEGFSNENVCRNILATYPKLPLLGDSQFVECVKIVPQDLGKLSMGNWKLGINSFLSHGYYHYRYIMLGKLKMGKEEVFVVGVPGVFTNKEKYLANMFGFSVFIPAKRTKMLTGNFGYWISEVTKE